MSNFKIGEKVVCVDDSLRESGKTKPRIKKGEIYTIVAIHNCCSESLIVKEILNIGLKKCNCGSIIQSNGYYSNRFRKLDHAHTDRIIAKLLKIEEVQLN
jgi:hypothetical protein